MDKYTAPHFSSSALIVIDTQCDTLDGQPLEIPGTSSALPNMKRVLDIFRRQKRPIIHIVRIYKKDASNVDLCRKEKVENGADILLEGSPGCEIARELFGPEKITLDPDHLLSGGIQKISDTEFIIYKPRWGAFYNTPLQRLLEELDIDTVVFIGCNFPNCPRTSIYEAGERDYRIVLVEDAISGLYDKGRQEMINIGVHLSKTADLPTGS